MDEKLSYSSTIISALIFFPQNLIIYIVEYSWHLKINQCCEFLTWLVSSLPPIHLNTRWPYTDHPSHIDPVWQLFQILSKWLKIWTIVQLTKQNYVLVVDKQAIIPVLAKKLWRCFFKDFSNSSYGGDLLLRTETIWALLQVHLTFIGVKFQQN